MREIGASLLGEVETSVGRRMWITTGETALSFASEVDFGSLDKGVKPREISEIITQLAFYSGWANAMSAVAVEKDVFADRKIGAGQLPPASPALLPLDNDAEAKRGCGTAVRQRRSGHRAVHH